MKRLRDDACANSQFKRPLGGSRGESYGQPQIPGERGVGGGGATSAAAAQKLTTNDALTYLKEVKDIFQNQKDKYNMFLDIMKDFKSQRINTTGVIARVKELFEGHNNLILGFNTFLPKGYEITLIDEEEAPAKRTVEFDEAISFVNKIKKRFQNEDRVYKSFLDILNMYRKDHKSITEVYREVAALFDDHPDLLEEFTIFLPDTSATTSAAHVSIGRHSFHRQTHTDRQRYRRDRINGPHTERDLSVERPELDDNKLTTKLHKEQRKRAEKENRDRQSCGQDHRGPDHENNGGMNVHRLLDKKKSLQKVDDFGVDTVFPSNDDKVSLKCMFNQEFFFFEKVKERLHNPDDYQAFLKCLHIYSTEIITRKELQSLVADLLGKYPDLMEGFRKFLERCESIDGFLAGITRKKSFWNEGHVSKLVKEEDNKEQRREMDAYKENDKSKEKYWNKSIEELDLSNCERCTPSYRLLPPDYPIPSTSQRSELGAQVLNDHWVSVTSGSEDYSFTHMRRNQYEESLFRCEDDRFELDMLLESVSSAAKHAEELLNSINDNSINPDSPIHIEDHFTVLNLRCIERVYGDHGLDVMDVLRKNPSLALPVILIRLKQKQEAWSKSCLDFNMVWAEIYAKNHYKSLDHRSFYFKQQDLKNLSTKSLVAEIYEMKKKKQKEDNMHLDIAAGSTHPIVPTLEFEYSDTNIHEDLYKLIKYSCEEACTTKEQFNKVMNLWTTFLEPMLGVPSQAHSSNDTEYVMSKQSKSICNGRQITSPDRVESCRLSLVNGDTFSKEDGYQLKKTAGADIVSGFNRTVGPCGQITTSDAALAVGADIIHCRISMETTSGHDATTSRPGNNASEDGHGSKSNIDDVPSSESCASRSLAVAVAVANGGDTEGTKVDAFDKDSAAPSKNEKEEGELSPNGDIEEDNFVAYGNNSYQATPNANHIPQSMHCLPGENRANVDDEESENVLEASEDVLGNESAADECSLEDHEEEEDGEFIGLNGKAESKCEAERVDNARFVGEGESVPSLERFLLTAKPLLKHAASPLYDSGKKGSQVFYGNDTFYVVFRLHQILYERLLSAKSNSTSAETKWKTAKDAGPSNPYCRFMGALYDLLDGSADNSKFEDDCRAIIGNQSYVLFTLDKLINRLVKQLQTVASDEMENKLLQLYDYEKSRNCEKYVDSVYYENAHVLLHDENIYRFESSSDPNHLSIQLMDHVNEKAGVAVCVDPFFAAYLHNDFLSVDPSKKELPGIMLQRNKRKYADLDEGSTTCMAKKGVCTVNGLECNMACNSSKISYGVNTEDFFFRERRERRHLSMNRSTTHGCSRAQRFQRFLTASV